MSPMWGSTHSLLWVKSWVVHLWFKSREAFKELGQQVVMGRGLGAKRSHMNKQENARNSSPPDDNYLASTEASKNMGGP